MTRPRRTRREPLPRTSERHAFHQAKEIARNTQEVALVFYCPHRTTTADKSYVAVAEHDRDTRLDDRRIVFAVWPDGRVS